MDHRQKNVDLIFMKLRPFGFYQVTRIAYMLISYFIADVLNLNYYFIGYSPPHHCRPLEDPLSQYGINTDRNLSSFTAEYQQCNVKLSDNQTMSNQSNIVVGCLEGHQFDYEYGDNIVIEWNLVCSQKGIKQTSQIVVMAGQLVGATLFPTLSDRYGRKRVFVIAHLLLFISSLASSFVPSFTFFVVVRFIQGILQQGLALSLSTLSIELYPKKYRRISVVVAQIGYTFNLTVISAISYFMRYTSWRYPLIVTALCSFHAIFSYWILDESVRWLFVNNRHEEAIKIIKKIARVNNVHYGQVAEILTDETELDEKTVSARPSDVSTQLDGKPNTNSRINFFNIFRHRLMLKYSLISWFVWCINSLTYYGLYLISLPLTGNRYLDFFLNGLCEFPGVILFLFCADRIGRRRSSIMFHSVTGVSLIIFIMLYAYGGGSQGVKVIYVILNYVGKLGISASFALLFLYTQEMYPTNLRNVGLGVCSCFSRIGAMIAPYSDTFASYVTWGPGVVFGGCCLLAAVLITQLPETMGRELPQTIEDIAAWRKNKIGNMKSMSCHITKQDA